MGDGKGVGMGARVEVGMAARVALTACWIWMLGSGVAFGEQAARSSRIRLTVKRRGVCFFIQKIIQEKPRQISTGLWFDLVSTSVGRGAIDDLWVGFTFDDEHSNETAL